MSAFDLRYWLLLLCHGGRVIRALVVQVDELFQFWQAVNPDKLIVLYGLYGVPRGA